MGLVFSFIAIGRIAVDMGQRELSPPKHDGRSSFLSFVQAHSLYSLVLCTLCKFVVPDVGGRITTYSTHVTCRYGVTFLQESYLYHLSRQDHRHNFSLYFYYLYLTASSVQPSLFARLVSFGPQLGLVAFLGILYGSEDLPFACFSQTFAFVMLNKVVTSQVCTLWPVNSSRK